MCGSEINHIYMKIRNWSKFIMFHRYFRPIARKIWSASRQTESTLIDEATLSPSFSNSSSSEALICGGMVKKKLTVSLS